MIFHFKIFSKFIPSYKIFGYVNLVHSMMILALLNFRQLFDLEKNNVPL